MEVFVLLVDDCIVGVYSNYETGAECEAIFRSKSSLYYDSKIKIECHTIKE